MTNYKSLIVRHDGDATIASLRPAQFAGLGAYLILSDDRANLLQVEQPRRRLNFAGVELTGSDAIGVPIQLRSKLSDSGGDLKLCGQAPHVRLAFKGLNLDGTLLKIFDSKSQGIAAFD